MATPYGHTLAGLSLFNLWYSRAGLSRGKGVLVYGLVALGASFPDLDFIPGLILGQAGRFHHGYSHSLGIVIIVSLIVGLLAKWIHREGSFFKIGSFALALGVSHLILDFFTEAPKGFPMLWPFTETKFLSALPVLPRVERTLGHPELYTHALFCFVVESLLLIPLWMTSFWRRSLAGKTGQTFY
jgi:membrane-bound metal-dependent hydrolase YbcI (DUF457 family)